MLRFGCLARESVAGLQAAATFPSMGKEEPPVTRLRGSDKATHRQPEGLPHATPKALPNAGAVWPGPFLAVAHAS